MVKIVAGQDTGLFHGGFAPRIDRIQAPGIFGQAGEQIFVNVAQGNVILQRRDELLVGRGIDADVLRTYNSQAKFTDDNNDAWWVSGYRQLRNLTGTANTAGSTIERISADGSVQRFTYRDGRYISTDGDGAHDTLSQDGGAWTWTEGNSRIQERYKPDGSIYRLDQVKDTTGNTITYTFNSGLLNKTTLANGDCIDYVYTGHNLSQEKITGADGTAVSRTYYRYDNLNRLNEVSIDLSPNDNSIADGKVYSVKYGYDGTSQRLTSLTQTDGNELHFSYQLVANNDYRVASISDSLGRITRFSYDLAQRITTVINPLGQTTRYTCDIQGRFTEITGPVVKGRTQTLRYQFDANGNLSQTTNAHGDRSDYTYDANGNLLSQRDTRGRRIEHRYNNQNQLITETSYPTTKVGAAQGSGAQTTRYVYDDKQNLRFVLTHTGQVTEYHYDGFGQRTSQLDYNHGRYNVGPLAVEASPSLTELETWARTQANQVSREDYAYDGRGGLQQVIRSCNTVTSGDNANTCQTTRYTYDLSGRLLTKVEVRSDGNRQQSYGYDGLGRLLSTLDSAAPNQAITHLYDDASRRLTINRPNNRHLIYSYEAIGAQKRPLPLSLNTLSFEDKLANFILASAFSNEHIEINIGRPPNTPNSNGRTSPKLIQENARIFEERVTQCVTEFKQRKEQQLRINSYIEGGHTQPEPPKMTKGWNDVSDIRMSTVAVAVVDDTLYISANYKTLASNITKDNTVNKPNKNDAIAFSLQQDNPSNRVAILDQLYNELADEAPFDKVVFVEMAKTPANYEDTAAPHAEMQLLSYLKSQGKNLEYATFGISKPACIRCQDELRSNNILFRDGEVTGEFTNTAPGNWLSQEQISARGGVAAKYDAFITHGVPINDYRAVNTEQWRKPSPSELSRPHIVATAGDASSKASKPHIIIQLDGDPISFNTALSLYRKYQADQVRWLQWNPTAGKGKIVDAVSLDSLNQLPYLNAASLWVVGHTDRTDEMASGTQLAGLSADQLVTKLFGADLAGALPSQITLLGTGAGEMGPRSYNHLLAEQMAERIARRAPSARVAIHARDALTRVNTMGRYETLHFTEQGDANWKAGNSSQKIIVETNGRGAISKSSSRNDLVNPLADRTLLLTDTALRQPARAIQAHFIDQSLIQLGLQQQEADRVVEELRRATNHFITPEKHPEQWVPLLDTVKEEPNGRYSIAFSNRQNPENIERYEGSDAGFINATRYLAEKRRLIREENDHEGSSIDGTGLTAATIFQYLIRKLNEKDRQDTTSAGPSVDQNLALALQIHDYVNMVQLGHAALQDLNQLRQLVKNALSTEDALRSVPGASSKLLAKAGTGLQFINWGLDIYELSQASSEQQKTIFGTQLAFDSASLVLEGIGFLGGAEVAAITGPAGVLLAGLGVGIVGLAERFSEIAANTEAVADHFAQLKSAYASKTPTASGGYRYDASNQLLVPFPLAVFQTLDLRERQATFSSPMLYSSRHGITGSGRIHYFFWAGDMPKSMPDKSLALDILSRLNIAPQSSLPGDSNSQQPDSGANSLLLPAIPKYYIDYRYNLLPFATTRHLFAGADHGFNVLRKLEEQGDFDYDFYIFPSEQIIEKISFEYVPTDIKVMLDRYIRNLQMPKLPNELHGHLHYVLQAQSGEYRLGLEPGSRVTLKSDDPANTKWVLDARALSNRDVVFGSGTLSIGGITISLPDSVPPQEIHVLKQDDQMVRLNLSTRQEVPVPTNVIDAATLQTRGESLSSHLQRLASHHQLTSDYVLILHYVPPAQGGQPASPIPRAYYDVKNARYLYAKDYPNAVLVTQSGNDAYFYDQSSQPHQVLRVDVNTKETRARYRLPSNSGSLKVWQEMGSVYLVAHPPGTQDIAIYRIVGDTLQLVRIRAGATFVEQFNTTGQIPDLAATLRQLLGSAETILPNTPSPQPAQLPADGYIAVDQAAPAGKLRQRFWLRRHDGAVIKPVLPPIVRYNDYIVPPDLTLASCSRLTNGSEVFYFYSAKEKQVFRQEGRNTVATLLDLPGLTQLSIVNGQPFIVTQDGLVQKLNHQGKLSPIAVTGTWLKNHPSWWQDLKALAGTDTLSVLDIKDSDNTALAVWLKEDTVVIADPGLPDTVQLLGLDAGSTLYAWLYDPSSSRLYKQWLLDDTDLSEAFGQGAKLLTRIPFPRNIETQAVPSLSVLGNTLALQTTTYAPPPQIKGIDQLVITPRDPSTMTLDAVLWSHYRNVVVDLSQIAPADAARMQIKLTLPNPYALQVERVGDDWVILDPIAGKSLVFKNAYAAPSALNAAVSLVLPDRERTVRTLNPLYDLFKEPAPLASNAIPPRSKEIARTV
ncbi:TcdA/TcdB pore-forming domain-containing protein [Chitinimonas sp. PSY-7]|uniref:TcdA/TcdB pore-forming domain-containing protein n=1 Tax=Chitinimonas sp. PSY-7 TaxID=3459088 RepID=UPI00403FD1FD